MERMATRSLIDTLGSTLKQQINRLEQFRSMDEELLVTRPAPDRWSIVEIAEHLNLSSGHYYERLRKIYNDPASQLVYRDQYTPGRFGEMSVKAMRPTPDGVINWKMRTLGMFEPRTASTKGTRALDELRSMNEGFLEMLTKAHTRGLEGEKVTSTLGSILRFKVGDAFRFPVAHQQRHFVQMEKVFTTVRAELGTVRPASSGAVTQ